MYIFIKTRFQKITIKGHDFFNIPVYNKNLGFRTKSQNYPKFAVFQMSQFYVEKLQNLIFYTLIYQLINFIKMHKRVL